MNRDLFLTILSMDSYNRGYGRGIKFTIGESTADRTDFGAKIGNATVLSIDLPGGSKGAGFYALAYDWNGQTIVTYRGSDNFLGQGGFVRAVGGLITGINNDNDIFNGYGVAFGQPDGLQARLSIQFYRAVAESLGHGETLNQANITVTGHSLGGGLGGLVAAIYNRPLFAVDPMQFGNAADKAWAKLDPDSPEYDSLFAVRVTGTDYPDWERQQPSFFSGVAIPWGDNSPQSNLLDSARRNTQGASPTGVPIRDLDFDQPTMLGWSTRNKVGQRHSNALIVMRLFSEGLDSQDWDYAGKYFLPMLFDEPTGEAAGGAQIDASADGDRSGAMRDAIAYSALKEGERPFGDTGIDALFDDMNELGAVMKVGSHNPFFDQNVELTFEFSPTQGLSLTNDVARTIARIATQYAGALAIRDVEGGMIATSAGAVNADEGVLGLSSNVLALDVSSILWDEVLNQGSRKLQGGNKVDPINFETFKAAYFEQSPETSDLGSGIGDFIKNLFGRVLGFSGRTYDEDELNELVKLG
jgi:hypothetical protein